MSVGIDTAEFTVRAHDEADSALLWFDHGSGPRQREA
jgi:hypothetical protein